MQQIICMLLYENWSSVIEVMQFYMGGCQINGSDIWH